MTTYKFDCGCEFPIVDDGQIKDCDGLPPLHIDFYNLPDCPAVWDIFHSGKTKGIFQLEKQLGQGWSKSVKPSNIDEIAALIAIIRPGTLHSYLDGKNMTQHYSDRKNAQEEAKYFTQALEPILRDTYGIIVYQEQAIRIAKDLAGFTLQEADQLRKAIGKKDSKLMAETETLFLAKAKTHGVIDDETAKQIFNWIKESNRYAFNKSHSVAYAELGYWSAYLKHHFPFHFFTSWLQFRKDDKDTNETELLVNDCKYFDVPVTLPSTLNVHLGDPGQTVLKKNQVCLGFSDIKGVGESQVDKIINAITILEEKLGNIKTWKWIDYLVKLFPMISSTSVNGLISAGALSHLAKSRTSMLFEYNILRELTDAQIKYLDGKDLQDLGEILSYLSGHHKVRNKEKIEGLLHRYKHAGYSLTDGISVISRMENEFLDISLSCTKLDDCEHAIGNATCDEISKGKTGKNIILAVEITEAKEYIIKKAGPNLGKPMGFLSVSDETGPLTNVTVFSNIYEPNKHLFYKGSTLLLQGNVDTRNSKTSFVIEKITPI